MRVDALTLWAVADELHGLLANARIDPVIAPTPHAVALCCYGGGQNRWLLVSAHPQLARVHLLPAKPQKLVAEPSSFVMLLRKYLEGSRVHAVRAARWERVIMLDVRHAGVDEPNITLIAEIMGNLANIILVDARQMVLGALHPVSQHVNRYRAILPGHPYVPPPPQTRTLAGATLPRIPPEAVTGADLLLAAQEAPAEPAWRVVMGQLAGASPDLAQEIVCRALGDAQAVIAPEAPDAPARYEAVAATTREIAAIAESGAWEPTAILDDAGQIADGWVLRPCMAASKPQRPMPSVNELLAAYFAAREWHDAVGAAGGDLRRILKTAAERLQKKLKLLQADLTALNAADRLRHEGELLLTFASEIPAGATSYTVPDLGDGQGATTITLDPRLTGVENANARFARYHKMRRAAEKIPEQIARAEIDLARVAQLQTDLDLAETSADLSHVRAEIAEARLARGDKDDAKPHKVKKAPNKGKYGAKGKAPAKQHQGGEPLRFTTPEGFTIYAGKNSHQNEYVTFDVATGGDVWLHARGVPGAHVIIKAGGRPVPEAILRAAAGLAAWYSQSRGAGSVPVDYTEQRYVRHMKDGGPGMVTYSKERTLSVTPKVL
jgi:predicted ribosome quality control (RQC) complex YloA/Tae2 family protein